MARQTYIAVDLGAESGRVILGRIANDRLSLEEVHRFANGPVPIGSSLHWNVLGLYRQITTGLTAASQKLDTPPAGIGLDTWGVDFGLLGPNDELLGIPHHYRDPRNPPMVDFAFSRISPEQLYAWTGIQTMPLNSLFQLLAFQKASPAMLELAETFLTIPDLFNFWLTGRKVCEFSNATTTQLYDPRKKTWADPLFEALGLPRRMMPDVVQPGTVLAPLRREIAEHVGLSEIPVIAPACHDTGSAVAAIPVQENANWAFISSGTWSLMGMEVPGPIITPHAQQNNFTNEGGVANTIRFLKNIMGLWLVQECRRTWQRQGDAYDYGQLSEMAAAAKPFANWVDPDDASFLAPGDMPARIAAFCQKNGQNPPTTPGAFVRCCLESLALKYRWAVERLEQCTNRKVDVIHVVGGGIKNTFLCQMTADATGRTVITGPVEATAAGNVMMQAIAAGRLKNVAQGRALVRESFELATYTPKNTDAWQAPYDRICGYWESATRQ